MSIYYRVGESTKLSLQLSDGAEDQYPRAFLYKNGVFEVAISLNHLAGGLYLGVWVPSIADQYEIVFICYLDPARTLESYRYERVEEIWQPVDWIAADSADKLLDSALSGHSIVGSVGEALARLSLIEKIQRNRLELAEGSVNNWILYDDDSSTPLLRWDVTDKAGDGIRMNSFIPARRTRGI